MSEVNYSEKSVQSLRSELYLKAVSTPFVYAGETESSIAAKFVLKSVLLAQLYVALIGLTIGAGL